MPLWTVILKQAPALLAAADALLARSRQASTAANVTQDAQALRQQLAELYQQQQAQTDLIKALADQTAAVALAAQATAGRARTALIVGSAGLGVAILAVLLALLVR